MEQRPKAGLTKFQRFTVATVAGFAYAVINTRLFLSFSRWLFCWFRKKLRHSSANWLWHCLGFDWNAISGYMGNNARHFPFSSFDICDKSGQNKSSQWEWPYIQSERVSKLLKFIHNCYSPINGWVWICGYYRYYHSFCRFPCEVHNGTYWHNAWFLDWLNSHLHFCTKRINKFNAVDILSTEAWHIWLQN